MSKDKILPSKIPPLSPRLRAIADEVRPGTCLYDVGTDHAYLPAALAAEGKISSAVASDIGKGPLARAAETIARAGLSDAVRTVLTPGLSGLDPVGFCDIVIAGMGGEMIASILAERGDRFDESVRLILQPMSKHEHLRRFLGEHGFAVLSERYVEDGGKVYPVLVCGFTGENYTLTPTEQAIGRADIRLMTPAYLRFLKEKSDTLNDIMRGKATAGLSVEEEALIYDEINRVIAAFEREA